MSQFPTLGGRSIFLSASFPSGPRAEGFPAADPAAIADAVSAVTRAVLDSGGRLVFGAHPTISPLILLIAAEGNHKGLVDIYQSLWFERKIPEETLRLESEGFGEIHWTPAMKTRRASLRAMREEMFSHPLAGAVFIGGMEGIRDELDMVGGLHPGVPCTPLAGPGGAARAVASKIPTVSELQSSDRYPLVARSLIAAFASASAGG